MFYLPIYCTVPILTYCLNLWTGSQLCECCTRGFVPTHYNCGWILVLATLKKATWVAETCWYSPHNTRKLTFIHANALVGLSLITILLFLCVRFHPPNPSMHFSSPHTCYLKFPSFIFGMISQVLFVQYKSSSFSWCNELQSPVIPYSYREPHGGRPPLFCCPKRLIQHIDRHR
jgi:hypothetical protein